MSKPNPSGAPEKEQKVATPAPGGGGTHKPATTQAPTNNNVVALPGMCMADSCKKRSEKANFCMEHFDWFKEGLITKEGRRPSDFEKKHFDYTRRLAKRKSA